MIARLLAALALATPVFAQTPEIASRIFIASDSTAANYEPDQYPQMGWGMFLGCSLSPSIEVVNLARGGRSTKTYREEGLWAVLLTRVRPGDTVLIQFGHNDEDVKKPWRYTDAKGDFTRNLTSLVEDVLQHQGQPMLLTPVARAEFSGGHIRETHGDYALAVRDVAATTKTPLIDLNAKIMAFLDSAGAEGAKRYFHDDTTHLNELGARATAAIVARELAGLGLPVSAQIRAPAPEAVHALGNSACE